MARGKKIAIPFLPKNFARQTTLAINNALKGFAELVDNDTMAGPANMATDGNAWARINDTAVGQDSAITNDMAMNTIMPVNSVAGLHNTRNESGTTQSSPEAGLPMLPKKAPRPRPLGPRVLCDMCEEYPDGFRGPHELNRHKALKHNGRVTGYICQNAGQTVTASGQKLLRPLSECSRCKENWQYYSVQNAVEHLRRNHFAEKKKPHGLRVTLKSFDDRVSLSHNPWAA
ncbi:hypothetical protein M419DRAFT_37374 [Trichoderma reesei RUT C-30]|jgi:hypothetical protein|uniref:DUF7896 domain-containing protein n=1 Tax=Hypocrea jecorina (strain ATCC 56765 / BCRC 32924 / NRRL 11460 / Rut C-30) TaxID=1344414 RepID=A0A024S5A9_HYPJR|nr:hypothetical protein M419DRAFT_37374 [Trichoderma reesei RUT C-30]